ncbi:MAG: hypothetical protein WC788_06765 [Candidatus Paceibacterota bacterium]|jgi:hypothetical protein
MKTISGKEASQILCKNGFIGEEYYVIGQILIPENFRGHGAEIYCSNSGILVKCHLKHLAILQGVTAVLEIADNSFVEKITVNGSVEALIFSQSEKGSSPGRVKELLVGSGLLQAYDYTGMGILSVCNGGAIDSVRIQKNAHLTSAIVENLLLAQQLQMQGIKTYISQENIKKGMKKMMLG